MSQPGRDEIDFSESQGAPGSGQQQGGQQAAQQGGLPGGPQAGGQQAGGQPPADGGSSGPDTRSYAERVADLERELEGSMSEYDGMILRERRNVLAEANQQGAEEQVETFDRSVAYYDEGDLSQSGDAGSGEDGTGQGPGGGPGGMQPTSAQGGGQPGGSNGGAPGRANDKAYAPPADIPSGNDDDVVARQIREAAMYEDDPELREKLWEEYRKYKAQTR